MADYLIELATSPTRRDPSAPDYAPPENPEIDLDVHNSKALGHWQQLRPPLRLWAQELHNPFPLRREVQMSWKP